MELRHDCSVGACPIVGFLDVLERKWALRIIREIYGGNTHFNQLKRSMNGVTAAVLSKRLKELEGAHLISRKVLGNSRAEVEYGLGEDAREIAECWGRHPPLRGIAGNA